MVACDKGFNAIYTKQLTGRAQMMHGCNTDMTTEIINEDIYNLYMYYTRVFNLKEKLKAVSDTCS